jgi:8-oxo-dGTP pyrophosphatase MutT (NUDIX family)
MHDNPDLPANAGFWRGLHLFAGVQLATLSGLLRPSLSLGVRLAAFDDEGRVFLVRHSYVPGFYLPGGGVEKGETARAAAIREAEEEGGLVFDAPPELFHVYLNERTGRRDHVLLFVAQNVHQAPGAKPAAVEILEAGFHPPDDLPEDATRATRARIAEVTGGAAPGDIW